MALVTMGTLNAVIAIVAVSGFMLMLGLQVFIRRRGTAMMGTPVRDLPGELGPRIAASPHALIYFFSPTCGACRAITPGIKALEAHNPNVFAVDVTRDVELAMALKVMATPSTVELAHGTIVGYSVGRLPPALLDRFRA